MKRFELNRRAFLRGAGTAAVGLPLLEIMLDAKTSRAQSIAPPLRYLTTFSGIASATDRTGDQYLKPGSTGAGYLASLPMTPGDAASPNTSGFLSIKELDLAGVTTLVSNMHLPRGQGPAHWSERWHSPTMRPLLSGMSGQTHLIESITSDYIVAKALGPGGRFPHLALRAQPKRYRNAEAEVGDSVRGRMSHDGLTSVEPFTDPAQTFDQMFGKGGDLSAPGAKLRHDKEVAVVDAVLARAERLNQRLGSWDRHRLEQHLEELRGIERRIAQLAADPSAQCITPARPPADFPEELTSRTGWSNEILRCELMNDLMHMALVCDMTRAGSLMYTFGQSFTAVKDIVGRDIDTDIHEITHSGGDADRGTDLAKIWYWSVKNWATLVNKLRNSPEGNGSSVLDNTVTLFLSEAGSGVEEGAGNLNDNFGAHSGNNMYLMIAGGAGGKLKHQGHIDGAKAHPGQLIVSAMRAVGVNAPLGEITQGLPSLGV